MKVYAFPPHCRDNRTSGVDFARVIQPMKMVAKQSGFDVKIFQSVTNKLDDWRDIGKEFDVIFFNYITNDWGYAYMGCYNRMYKHKIVLDVDDNLWNVLPDNSSYEHYKKDGEGVRNFTAICRDVDVITTTNSYLRNVIHHNTGVDLERIHVIPNCIDLSVYNTTVAPRNAYDVVIGHMGSTSHFASLQEPEFVKGMDRIMKEFPNVKFRTIGALIPKFKKAWGLRYENDFGHEDIYEWAKLLPKKMEDIDFVAVPLTNNQYNRCKSSIKFLETASTKRTGVYQAIRQYQEIVDGNNGFLAGDAESWYNSMKILIENKQKRDEMAENAYKTVVNGWQMKDHVQKYVDLLKSLA